MQPTSDHNRIDARNLAFHRLIASKIAADPSIILRAQDWLRDEELANYKATHEWAVVLSWPVANIVEFLNGDTEKLIRLCQSTPFLGVITEEERRSINESNGIRARYPGSQRHLR
jgi:predicted GTPase